MSDTIYYDALQRITECDMRWSKKIARNALEAAK